MQRGLVEVRQNISMNRFEPGDPSRVGMPSAVPIAEQRSDSVPGMPISPWAYPLPGMVGSNFGNSPVLALDTTFHQVNDALVSQFARFRAGQRFGLALSPVNANETSLDELLDAWRGTQQQINVGRVISQDLEVVGPGMENVSLEDIVRFREKYGEAHRDYMRELRSFVRDLSQESAEAAENELFERRRDDES
jgi:hypothetical protein